MVLAVIGTVAAIRLVTARNVVHAALYLVVTLADGRPAAYLLLAAEFVAWVQVLIYVGAIVVLFLFGLMLTKAPIGREVLDNQQRGVAVVVAVAILAGLVFLIQDAFVGRGQDRSRPGERGRASDSRSSSTYVLPFEVVSFLLLAALIGAIVLAAEGRAGRRDPPSPRPVLLGLPVLGGVYGVLARRNAVLVLMSIELMLNAVNVNLVAFSPAARTTSPGQVFALFVIAVAAAEVGIGLAIVILIYRNRETINVDEVNLLKW